MESYGQCKVDRLSECSWIGRIYFIKECSLMFNMASLLCESNWQSTRMNAAVFTFPHSQKGVCARPILNMCSFSLLFPVISLIQVASYDLVLIQEFSLLAGIDGHMVWKFCHRAISSLTIYQSSTSFSHQCSQDFITDKATTRIRNWHPWHPFAHPALDQHTWPLHQLACYNKASMLVYVSNWPQDLHSPQGSSPGGNSANQ